jgi:hypothetical protein
MRQNFSSFRLGDRHAGHQKDGPGEQLGTIRGNRVAFRVAFRVADGSRTQFSS